MQRDISTNIRIPEELWRAIKIRAAEEKRSMKDLFLEALGLLLGTKKQPLKKTRLGSLKNHIRIQGDIVHHDSSADWETLSS